MTVLYDSSNSCALMLRWDGTIWPRVLPWCLFFVGVYPMMCVANGFYGFEKTDAARAAGFTILVSLLVVMLGEVQYRRFKAQVETLFHLVVCIKRSGTLVAIYCSAMEQRIIDYRKDVADALEDVIQILIRVFVEPEFVSRLSDDVNCDLPDPIESFKKFEHLISQQSIKLGEKHAMAIQKEMQILSLVDQMFDSYDDLATFAQTPMPFPMVNLGRTIVMVYLFFIPILFVQEHDIFTVTNYLVVFFSVYGYLGLELVFSDFSEPFGDDPADVEIESYLMEALMETSRILLGDMTRFFEVEKEFEGSVASSTVDSSFDDEDSIDGRSMFFQLGKAQYDMKNFDRAEHFLNKIVCSDEDTVEAALATEMLGDIARSREKIESALSYYESALNLNIPKSNYPSVLLKAGHMYFNMSRFNDAHSSYQLSLDHMEFDSSQSQLFEELKKSDEIWTLKFRLGLLLLKDAKYAEALRLFRDIFETDKAEKIYDQQDKEKSEERASKYAYLCICMGMAHEGLGQLEWAILRLTEASTIQKRFLGISELLDSTYLLIRVYKRFGDEEEITSALSKKGQRIRDEVLKRITQQTVVSVSTQWRDDFKAMYFTTS